MNGVRLVWLGVRVSAMQPLSIQVVDDEPLMRWSVVQTLADCGHHVIERGDAQGALRALRGAQYPFDLVLLDLQLPDSGDLSLLANIREAMPTTNVILMTAFNTPEIAYGARALGASRVIDKPFDMGALPALVAAATACN
jgi:DNA-binding NtrC family response regulator